MFDKLQQELETTGARALVVVAKSSRDPDLAPFVGPIHLGWSLVVVAKGRAPRVGFFTPMEREEAASCGLELLDPEALDVARWSRDAASEEEMLAGVIGRALQLCEVAPGAVAIAGHAGIGTVLGATRHLATEGWSFLSGEKMLLSWRRAKNARDVGLIRTAAAGTCRAMRRVAEMLRTASERGAELTLEGSPLTVGRLREAVAMVLAEYGLEQPEGNIIAPAEEAAVPHNTGTDGRTLYAGQSLIVDLFPKGHLFADCTRTFCVGTPSETLARAFAHVRGALEAAEAKAGPGVRGWSLQEIACEHLQGAGYATPISEPGTARGYVHNLGHGVGCDIHELPSFKKEAQGEEGILAEGDVVTLEPGLYYPDAGWGVRIEDLYLVTADGLENLIRLPRQLDPKVWD